MALSFQIAKKIYWNVYKLTQLIYRYQPKDIGWLQLYFNYDDNVTTREMKYYD